MSSGMPVSNNVSFSGQRLLPLVVKVYNTKFPKYKGTEVVSGVMDKCFFTRLTSEDRAHLREVQDRFYYFESAHGIVSDFLGYTNLCKKFKQDFPEQHFMLESATEKDPFKKIRGLVEISDKDGVIHVNFIESAESFNQEQKIVGAGMSMIYGVCRLAEKLGRNSIKLWSYDEAFDWYKKLGFVNSQGNSFVLKKADYPNFLKNLETRLKISRPDFCPRGKNAGSN